MTSALQVAGLLSLSLFGVVQCQNASSNVNDSSSILDLPSYMHYINATKNDRSPVTLNIELNNKSARNATAPDLYGLMHEDISHSGDGGKHCRHTICTQAINVVVSSRHIRRATSK